MKPQSIVMKKHKVLAVAMSLVMTFSLMPTWQKPAYADDPAPRAINLGSEVLKNNVNKGPSEIPSVFFGDNKEAWYVVGYDGEGNQGMSRAGTMSLLQRGVGEHSHFSNQDYQTYSNAYGWLDSDSDTPVVPSNLRSFIESRFITGYTEGETVIPARFSENEQAAIVAKDLEGGGSNFNGTKMKGKSVENALIWPLSLVEANALNPNLLYVGEGISWWLRTPGSSDKYAAYVFQAGFPYPDGASVKTIYGVRPAFDLNIDSVTLTSAAVGGKPESVGVDSLASIGENTTRNWKLTLNDTAHEGFKVESVKPCNSSILDITYSGAVKGLNEYVSALVKGKDGTLKYYGKLALAADEAHSTVKVDITGKAEKGDTLLVFNEQCNGDELTDFSSTLHEFVIPDDLHDWEDATCTEPKTCKHCGATEGNPLGHLYGPYVKLDAKQHQKVCQRDSSHVVKQNHTWDAGKVTKAATTTAEGIKTYTCTECKATKTETIPKLKPSTPKTSGTLRAQMTAKGKTNLVVLWSKITGAEGYDVFFSPCNHDGATFTCKKVKTIKGNKTFKWEKSGLKKNKAYKAYVKAYVVVQGKKKYVGTSPMVHAYTSGFTKSYTNAASVIVNKAQISLKKGHTFTIKTKVKGLVSQKKLMPKNHVTPMRFMTSNKKVASINKKGVLSAQGKGSCYVYAFAHNGVFKKIKVEVK